MIHSETGRDRSRLVHLIAAGRLRWEFTRLVRSRSERGIMIAPASVAFVLARLAITSVGGCDYLSFEQLAKRVGVAMPSDETVMAEISRAVVEAKQGRAWRLPTADMLGDLLNVTQDEHKELRLHAIGILGRPVSDRRRERDRARATRARATSGATPRAESNAAKQPWQVEGISRRTWYRRQKETEEPRGTNSSKHNKRKNNSADELVPKAPEEKRFVPAPPSPPILPGSIRARALGAATAEAEHERSWQQLVRQDKF